MKEIRDVSNKTDNTIENENSKSEKDENNLKNENNHNEEPDEKGYCVIS